MMCQGHPPAKGLSSPPSSAVLSCRLIDLEMARLVLVHDENDESLAAAHLFSSNDNQNKRQHQQGRFPVGGKLGYMPPEAVDGSITDFYASDIWSLGICLYIMLTGSPLYSDPNDYAFDLLCAGGASGLINHYSSVYGLHIPSSATDLICSMLSAKPSDRPTLEEIIDHPWFTPPCC